MKIKLTLENHTQEVEITLMGGSTIIVYGDGRISTAPQHCLTVDEVDMLHTNKYIAAIKSVRDRTRLTLSESKNLVCAYRDIIQPGWRTRL